MNQQVQVADSALAQVVEKLEGFERTPQGVSVSFARSVENGLRFVSEDRRWIAWNGACWDLSNALGKAEVLWDGYVRARVIAAQGLTGDVLKSELEHIRQLTSLRARTETLSLASTKLLVSREAFDREAKHLLVTPAGTFDLRNGSRSENLPAQLLTQCTKVPPDFNADCPQFTELLWYLSGEDLATYEWLWRAVGYTLTGDVREDAVFYLRGPGGNGKSTLVKTLFEILGSYAAKLDIRVLAHGSEFHATEIAHLRGARFVVSSEIEKGMKLRESVLKDLSGGEYQSARDLHQKAGDAARWVPSCKIWLYGNHDLIVRDTSDSIWRRLNKIASEHRFPQSGIRDALADREGGAILAAAIRAAGTWYDNGGLGSSPYRVAAATAAYRSQQDVLGQFFDECLIFEPDAFSELLALRSLYKTWAHGRDYDYTAGPDEFATRLRDRGCLAERRRLPNGSRPNGFVNVRVRNDKDPSN